MGFRVRRNESAADGLRRVATEEIDEALELLGRARTDPETGVHELRKKLKKIRSVVRLARDDLGEKVFERDNRTLQKLGRKLGPVRDASVRVAAARKLNEKGGKRIVPAGVEKRLVASRREADAKLRGGKTLDAIGRELQELHRRVRAWPLSRDGFGCLEPGLRRVYRRGRKVRTDAYASLADDDFHEWRKRAKDLRYAAELLERVWPASMKDLEKALHELTDDLGDDHDLAGLRATISHSRPVASAANGLPALVRRIDERRSELQAAARPLGDRIYSEKPKEFTSRLESYWDAWHSE